MESFTIKSIVLKWYYFCCVGSLVIYTEFSHLYMKQLGLSPRQIGFTNLMGVPSLLIPLCLFIGDKFRVRKVLLTTVLVLLLVSYFLPLLPLVSLAGIPCLTSNSSIAIGYKHSINGNGSVLSSSFAGKADAERASYSEDVPWLSNMLFLLVVSRVVNEFPSGIVIALADLVTIAYLKDQRANYGEYFMWGHVGGGISIFTVAMLAWFIKVDICRKEDYGYFIMYIVASCMVLLSMLSLPWFQYEYNENKIINLTELKSALFNVHFVFIICILFCIGVLVAFQIFWEFWYLDKLSASPLILGIAGLIRRPVQAGCMYLSCHLLRRIGELKSICVALFLFAVSFLVLSFTQIPWYVLATDLFQAAAYGLAYCSFTVHFSKAASKASAGVIRGFQETVYFLGLECGSTLLGVLFNYLGTRMALLIFSLNSGVLLVNLLLYIRFSKRVNDYEKLPQDTNEE